MSILGIEFQSNLYTTCALVHRNVSETSSAGGDAAMRLPTIAWWTEGKTVATCFVGPLVVDKTTLKNYESPWG